VGKVRNRSGFGCIPEINIDRPLTCDSDVQLLPMKNTVIYFNHSSILPKVLATKNDKTKLRQICSDNDNPKISVSCFGRRRFLQSVALTVLLGQRGASEASQVSVGNSVMQYLVMHVLLLD
jgi:hypothetical protein